jgi:hypothetical protein
MDELFDEYEQAMDLVQNKLGPILQKIDKKEVEVREGMTYLEMKYNLMITYCQMISFYIYLKLDPETSGKVNGHPVIKKLVHLKTLFEKLRPLD